MENIFQEYTSGEWEYELRIYSKNLSMSSKNIFLLLFMLSFWSCEQENTSESSKSSKPKVVATTGMIADLIKNIGRDSIEVVALMGPGVDPHLYKATQGDLANLQSADIIFYNGLHLEGKMGEVFEKLARVKKVVAIAENVGDDHLLADPVYKEVHDPHIWFDVSLWAATIDHATLTLIEEDPESTSYYQQNADAYKTTLAELHQWVKSEINSIPQEKRILITAHDAFNYFGKAYDIEVKGLQGISTLSEFGLKDRVELVNFIVDNQIKAVFVETSVSEKNINSIVEGCQQKGHEVIIGGNLYSDAMGAADTPEGTYTGMVRANVNSIVKALK
jgi:manganese/zinc/iron transport system substrate-binding protein